MRKYVGGQTVKLLRKVAAEGRKTARSGEQEAIHDLRVSIRRMRACLRLFSQFYPKGERKKLNQELKGLMHLAGEVRDRDIAKELLKDAGERETSAAVRNLEAQRQKAAAALLEALKHWSGRGVLRGWRKRLEV